MTSSPSSEGLTIDRRLVGAIAVVLLGGAAVLWYFLGSQNMWTGACSKVGLVMAALWMAMPNISRRDSWGQTSWMTLFGVLAMALVLIGKRVDMRLVMAMLFGFVIAMKFLRPASKPRAR